MVNWISKWRQEEVEKGEAGGKVEGMEEEVRGKSETRWRERGRCGEKREVRNWWKGGGNIERDGRKVKGMEKEDDENKIEKESKDLEERERKREVGD